MFNQSESTYCAYIWRLQGGPWREDFLSLSKKITFHSKLLPCSSRVNFQDGNISLSEQRITFWNLKTKEEALRNTRQVKRWNLELLKRRKHLSRTNSCFVKVKDNLPSQEIFRAADFLGNAQALLRVYGRVNYTFYDEREWFVDWCLCFRIFVWKTLIYRYQRNIEEHSSDQLLVHLLLRISINLQRSTINVAIWLATLLAIYSMIDSE